MVAVSMNISAIIVAALVAFVIRWLWYSPLLFGTPWQRLSGISKTDLEKAWKRGMVKTFIADLILCVITASVLELFLGLTRAAGAGQGMQIGFFLWLGFVATTTFRRLLWEMKPLTLWFLDNAFHLIACLVMGAILGAW